MCFAVAVPLTATAGQRTTAAQCLPLALRLFALTLPACGEASETRRRRAATHACSVMRQRSQFREKGLPYSSAEPFTIDGGNGADLPRWGTSFPVAISNTFQEDGWMRNTSRWLASKYARERSIASQSHLRK